MHFHIVSLWVHTCLPSAFSIVPAQTSCIAYSNAWRPCAIQGFACNYSCPRLYKWMHFDLIFWRLDSSKGSISVKGGERRVLILGHHRPKMQNPNNVMMISLMMATNMRSHHARDRMAMDYGHHEAKGEEKQSCSCCKHNSIYIFPHHCILTLSVAVYSCFF